MQVQKAGSPPQGTPSLQWSLGPDNVGPWWATGWTPMQGYTRPRRALFLPLPPPPPSPHHLCCLWQSSCPATEPHSCPHAAQAPRGWRRTAGLEPDGGWRLGAGARDTSAGLGAWHSDVPAGRGLPCCIPQLALTQVLPRPAAAPAPPLAPENASEARPLPPPGC